MPEKTMSGLTSSEQSSPGFVARMLAGHGAVGLAVGALLYILCLSGTVMVLHEEIERWEQPTISEMSAIDPAAAARAVETGLGRVAEAPHHLYLGLPNSDMPRATVSMDSDIGWFVSPDGTLGEQIHHPFTDFIQELHYYLHLPKIWGLTLVGILGVMLVKLVVSGFLAHPRIFKDAFAIRLGRSAQLGEADTHNRLSVWGAPFHILVALTGATLGLATVLSYFVSTTYHEGDITAFYEPIFGEEPAQAEAPAPLHDIEAALENFGAMHPSLEPWFLIMEDPATEGQMGYVLAKHPSRLIYGDNYYFDAAGTLTGTLGHADGPMGQQIVASAYTVHFGSFGGLSVKLVYIGLGLALTVVCATGINIWLAKRRAKGRPMPKLERFWKGTVWGTPVAMAACLVASLLGAEGLVLNLGFWALSLLIAALSVLAKDVATIGRVLRTAAGGTILLGLMIYSALNGVSGAVPALTVGLALTAVILILNGWRNGRARALAAAE